MSIHKVTSLTSPLAHVLFHRTQTRVLEEYQDLKDLHTEKKRNLSSINIHKSLTNSVSLTLKKKKRKLYDPPKKKTRRRNIFFYLHCRGYVYSGKLMEDERNDLTLSHANSGFFYQRDLDP